MSGEINKRGKRFFKESRHNEAPDRTLLAVSSSSFQSKSSPPR